MLSFEIFQCYLKDLVSPKPGDKMPNVIIEYSFLTPICGRGVVAIDGSHSTI